MLTRTSRGEAARYVIPEALLESPDARRIDSQADTWQALFAAKPASLEIKDQVQPITGPRALFRTVLEIGRKGLSIQRFKGLGEMNADQLWETTLDPEARTLLQVEIKHADDADSIFSTLMGDVVDPRRDFIRENALKVANLDI